ncbi:helix-turn-helix domain-containing protein [Streptomyces longwoodensis]|uniref:helix-turn-helix domain-containing protein n=1 Tax=Streptomyces longwoodensis TaxID=68231 RepID=UPI00340C8D36
MCALLAGELRTLKARTGLSMVTLAQRTAYSKSSWERYLNGKQLAPRQAVETLCAMAGEPSGRLVALWELADLEWSGRADRAVPSAADKAAVPPHGGQPGDHRISRDRPSPTSAGQRGPAWRRRVLVCLAALTAALGVTVLLRTAADDPTRMEPHASPAPGCQARTCTGHQPTAMGCAMPDQEQLLRDQLISPGTRLEIVYSTQCRAVWAVVGTVHVGDVLTVSIPGSTPERAEVADKYDAEIPLVTAMTDGSDLTGLQACYTPASGHSACFTARRETQSRSQSPAPAVTYRP